MNEAIFNVFFNIITYHNVEYNFSLSLSLFTLQRNL